MSDESPFLSDEVIEAITYPLIQPAARCRFLRSLGLTVNRKPNGNPLVTRSNVETVLGTEFIEIAASEHKHKPDRDGFIASYPSRRKIS